MPPWFARCQPRRHFAGPTISIGVSLAILLAACRPPSPTVGPDLAPQPPNIIESPGARSIWLDLDTPTRRMYHLAIAPSALGGPSASLSVRPSGARGQTLIFPERDLSEVRAYLVRAQAAPPGELGAIGRIRWSVRPAATGALCASGIYHDPALGGHPPPDIRIDIPIEDLPEVLRLF